MSTTTTYMGLTIPVGNIDPRATAEAMLQAAWMLVDAHDHSGGKGTGVTPAGLNINTDLTFTGNRALALKSAVLTSQSAALTDATDKGSLQNVLGDVWWVNSSGTGVQITSGSAINASSIGGITNLASPAQVAWVAASNLFSFTRSANYGAVMASGPLEIYDVGAGAGLNFVTVIAPASVASGQTITLPATTGTLACLTSAVAQSNTSAITTSSTSVGQLRLLPTTATQAAQIAFNNTGNNSVFGVDGNTGGTTNLTGTAYASMIWSTNSVPLIVGLNNAKVLTVAANGAVTFTGAVSGITTVGCGAITSTGALGLGSNTITCGTINGVTLSGTGTLATGSYTATFGGTFTTAGNFSTSGAHALICTLSADTNVTFPTSGTLATLAGSTLTTCTLTAPAINGTATSTGLTLSSSASVTQLYIEPQTTTNPATIQLLNATSYATGLIIGPESSSGSTFMSGSGAYHGVVSTVGAVALDFGANLTVRMSIASGGLITLPSLTSSAGTALVYSSGIYLLTSSSRFKSQIAPGRSFRDVDGIIAASYLRKGQEHFGLETGLIAEDAYKILPEIVNLDDEGKPFSINQNAGLAVALQMICELKSEIREMRSRW